MHTTVTQEEHAHKHTYVACLATTELYDYYGVVHILPSPKHTSYTYVHIHDHTCKLLASLLVLGRCASSIFTP
jgi:hypothetical protein